MRVAAAFLGCGLALAAARLAAAPPNIVVFISDDHSYRDTSTAGSPDVATPNFARIVARGMNFTHAFAVSPSCAPSRAALLTGLAPATNGSMFNHQLPRTDSKKLPAYLQELGYEVVAFGKVAHYDQVKQYGFDLTEHSGYHDDVCVAAAIEWLDKRESDKPLCLMVGTNWPHVPWPKAKAGTGRSTYALPPTHVDTPRTRLFRERYYAAVSKFDDDLGAVFDAAYRKLGDNTLFVHFSDHGAQWPFGKWNLYDAGLQIPLVAVWPGMIAPGSRCAALTTILDVLPTLIDAAGGKPSAELEGQSLLRQFRGESGQTRDTIFATHSGDGRMNDYPMRSARTRRYKYIRNLRPNAEFTTHIDKGQPADGANYWRSWKRKAETDGAARAIVERYHHRPAEELFDVVADPYEQHNLVGEATSVEILAQLRAEVDRWMTAHNDDGLATEKKFKPRPAVGAQPAE
jgi:uncharacterized sulfatase